MSGLGVGTCSPSAGKLTVMLRWQKRGRHPGRRLADRWAQDGRDTDLPAPAHEHGRAARGQAQGRHYSIFSFYTPHELRAAIAPFLARLPSPEVSWVDEQLLVIAGGSRHNQVESDGPASLANQATKDQAPRSAPGAPVRLPRGVLAAARRSQRYAPSRLLATTFGTALRSATCALGATSRATECDSVLARRRAADWVPKERAARRIGSVTVLCAVHRGGAMPGGGRGVTPPVPGGHPRDQQDGPQADRRWAGPAAATRPSQPPAAARVRCSPRAGAGGLAQRAGALIRSRLPSGSRSSSSHP